MDATVFRDSFVKPGLLALDAWSPEAEMLVVGTAAQESNLVYTRQIGGGPALGYFQMEPATHDDCWTNYIDFRAPLKAKIMAVRGAAGDPVASEMVTDHKYAAAMARVRYMRVAPAIPTAVRDIAAYWKLHYNTPLGAGSADDFIANWNRYLAPALYPPVA
jgi:hypothetical protein